VAAGSKGITGKDYVELTFDDVKAVVLKQFPGEAAHRNSLA